MSQLSLYVLYQFQGMQSITNYFKPPNPVHLIF